MISKLPEQEIIKAIREGDADVFRQVFDTCYDGLCRYAFTFLRNMDEAEDTVQFMFMKLWERKETLTIKASVASYLYGAVYHRCINQLEHKAIIRNHEQNKQREEAGEVQPDTVFPEELEATIRRAVDGLPPQCRTIFVMSRYEELPHAAIAARLGLSVHTVQNQICKALRILREELKDLLV